MSSPGHRPHVGHAPAEAPGCPARSPRAGLLHSPPGGVDKSQAGRFPAAPGWRAGSSGSRSSLPGARLRRIQKAFYRLAQCRRQHAARPRVIDIHAGQPGPVVGGLPGHRPRPAAIGHLAARTARIRVVRPARGRHCGRGCAGRAGRGPSIRRRRLASRARKAAEGRSRRGWRVRGGPAHRRWPPG